MDAAQRFFKGRRVLVIAPHPDDEAIGCGGAILRAVASGGEVAVIIVTVGSLQRVGDGGRLVEGSERTEEIERVTDFLGVREWEVLKSDDYSHMRLDGIPRRDLVALLERDARLSIRNYRPDVVMLPAHSYNQDHEAVLRAGLAATRPHDPAALHQAQAVLLYEYPPNSWCLPHERFQPNFYVDISDCLERKIEAYRLYRSQAREGLHQNSTENIRSLALLRGREIGAQAAEAYQALRMRV